MTRTVSVIIPAYNSAHVVGGAVSSILRQTHPIHEIIVVDDGSQDHTAQIVQAYGHPVRLISQANAGTAAARNRGIAEATGELLAFCDSDDELLPSFVASAMQAYEAAGAGRRFVVGNARIITEAGLTHGRNSLPYAVPKPEDQRLAILRHNFISMFSLAPRAMLEEVGGFDESMMVEDWDMWLRAIFSGWRGVAQPRPEALYFWSATSKSADHDTVFEGENAVILKAQRLFGDQFTPEEADFVRRRLDAGPPRLLVHRADLAVRAGDRQTAVENYRRARMLLPDNRNLRLKSLMAYAPGPGLSWALRRIDKRMKRDPNTAR